MMGITTKIRTAVTQDIPHILALAEMEYNLFEHKQPFNAELCEQYVYTIMNDSNALGIVLVDHKEIPFGYLSGAVDYIDLSTEPAAITHHWFVNNPHSMYGTKNYGLELLAAFEGWAKLKKCQSIRIGITMEPGRRRAYDRTFNSIGYKPNQVFYCKEIDK